MTKEIKNPEFLDIYTIQLSSGGEIVKSLIKAGTSELSNPDFLETDFRYTQDKLEFNSPGILNELGKTDKQKINLEGLGGIEKYSVTLFPSVLNSQEDDEFEYYSTKIGVNGDEIFCLLIPEEVDQVIMLDSKMEEAIVVSFEEGEIEFSKVLWVVCSSTGSPNPRTINLSYDAYKEDKNPVRRMSDYVLRNDELVENRMGYYIENEYLYSEISSSLVGTYKLENRPIYDLLKNFQDRSWNKRKRYSIGDTAWIGENRYESLESNNIGNHPYYSRLWRIYNDN